VVWCRGAEEYAGREPDLQGIWTDEFDTPLQRSAKYENQEFFTQAQRAELDKERTAVLERDSGRRTSVFRVLVRSRLP
jgi:hypothetical protein